MIIDVSVRRQESDMEIGVSLQEKIRQLQENDEVDDGTVRN